MLRSLIGELETVLQKRGNRKQERFSHEQHPRENIHRSQLIICPHQLTKRKVHYSLSFLLSYLDPRSHSVIYEGGAFMVIKLPFMMMWACYLMLTGA
jgi:hypothetical protein